jgi:hypothetical protein
MSRQQSLWVQILVERLAQAYLSFDLAIRAQCTLSFCKKKRENVNKFPVFLRLNTQQLQQISNKVFSSEVHQLKTLRGASC